MPARFKMACMKCGKATRNRPAYCDEHGQEPTKQYDKARGNSAQRGYGTPWRKHRKHVLERDHYLCQQCDRNGKVTPVGKSGHVDHIVPKSRGGTDDIDNLQTLCARCHGKKTRGE